VIAFNSHALGFCDLDDLEVPLQARYLEACGMDAVHRGSPSPSRKVSTTISTGQATDHLVIVHKEPTNLLAQRLRKKSKLASPRHLNLYCEVETDRLGACRAQREKCCSINSSNQSSSGYDYDLPTCTLTAPTQEADLSTMNVKNDGLQPRSHEGTMTAPPVQKTEEPSAVAPTPASHAI
jgi:hypothetical protein